MICNAFILVLTVLALANSFFKYYSKLFKLNIWKKIPVFLYVVEGLDLLQFSIRFLNEDWH